jgi:hypothetical protein
VIPDPEDSPDGQDSTGTGEAPETPVPGEETDLNQPAPLDSSGTDDSSNDTGLDSEGED